jgi:methylase of polypeptide subunit release factors
MSITKNKAIIFSDQALGAVMMALQNSLLNQTDIVPVLKGFDFIFDDNDELIVTNPPIIRADTSEDSTFE